MWPQVTRYRAFLLRVWATAHGEDVRASIKDVETGETHVFADLDGLREWLMHAMPKVESMR